MLLGCYWLCIGALTHWPKLPSPIDPTWLPIDKLVHAAMYSVLAGLWLWAANMFPLAARGGFSATVRQRLLTMAGVIGLYALLDELTQPWFQRTCDGRDLLTDWLAAGLVLVWFALRAQGARQPGA